MRFWLCWKNTEKQQKNSAALRFRKTRRNQDAEDSLCAKRDMTFWLELDNHLSKAGLAKSSKINRRWSWPMRKNLWGFFATNCFGIPFPLYHAGGQRIPAEKRERKALPPPLGSRNAETKVWDVYGLYSVWWEQSAFLSKMWLQRCRWVAYGRTRFWTAVGIVFVKPLSIQPQSVESEEWKNRSDRHVFLEK